MGPVSGIPGGLFFFQITNSTNFLDRTLLINTIPQRDGLEMLFSLHLLLNSTMVFEAFLVSHTDGNLCCLRLHDVSRIESNDGEQQVFLHLLNTARSAASPSALRAV